MGLSHMGDMDIIHFTLSAFRTLDSFISDGILNISWQNGSGVNYSPDGGEDFVSYEIFASASSVTMPASAPNAIYLLLCSMGLLAVRGFKKRS